MTACHYCPNVADTRDHVVPISIVRRTLHEPSQHFCAINTVPSCLDCNGTKADDFPTCDCETCRQVVDLFWREWRAASREYVAR